MTCVAFDCVAMTTALPVLSRLYCRNYSANGRGVLSKRKKNFEIKSRKNGNEAPTGRPSPPWRGGVALFYTRLIALRFRLLRCLFVKSAVNWMRPDERVETKTRESRGVVRGQGGKR